MPRDTRGRGPRPVTLGITARGLGPRGVAATFQSKHEPVQDIGVPIANPRSLEQDGAFLFLCNGRLVEATAPDSVSCACLTRTMAMAGSTTCATPQA